MCIHKFNDRQDTTVIALKFPAIITLSLETDISNASSSESVSIKEASESES